MQNQELLALLDYIEVSMDILTTIELEIANALKEIQTSTTLPQGYTFYNDVDIVNIEDESIIVNREDYPAISIYQETDEKVLSGEQNAFVCESYFRLVCMCALDDVVDAPQFAINQKMNELLSDIKAILSHRKNLNCSCDIVTILNSRRVPTKKSDELRVANLNVFIKVRYTQSRSNPNRNCIL